MLAGEIAVRASREKMTFLAARHLTGCGDHSKDSIDLAGFLAGSF